MFNLLPENLKAKIKSDYKLRFFIIIIIFFICVEISFLILLLPSWLISINKEQNAVLETNNANESQLSKDASPVSLIITATNQRLTAIDKTLQYPEFFPILNTILDNKTSSIRLTQFLYTPKDSANATLSLGGVSTTREALVSFVKALQTSGAFATVDLPISNLAKDTNISFLVNLTILKK